MIDGSVGQSGSSAVDAGGAPSVDVSEQAGGELPSAHPAAWLSHETLVVTDLAPRNTDAKWPPLALIPGANGGAPSWGILCAFRSVKGGFVEQFVCVQRSA